ncbi:hypothetical protein Y032_0378g295 [Ancylostoma ceylanicum]|uniref:Uncharacterized protein n=1 Tax=Ancylostoma ceylanicum TaxID=53326 RepID=A0A016RUI0_9BILA|nr:hypothetical protein Y032_0378g295 [Ancylostoma ceylanicum]
MSLATCLDRKFVIEKLLMLAYVIIRNTEKDSTLISGSRRPGVFDWSLRVTDASVFAIWFIIVWSVTSVTTMANQRFEMIIGINANEDDLDSDDDEQKKKKTKESRKDKTSMTEPSEDPNQPQLLMRRLLVLLTSCLFTSTALVSFGLTSFKVMHPIYSLMITVEGVSVLVRSVYVSYRVAWWQMVPHAAARQTEAFQRRVYVSKRIADVVLHSLATLMYTLYLIMGVIINGKLIPLMFVARLSHHIHRTVCNISDHLKGLGISKFLD